MDSPVKEDQTYRHYYLTRRGHILERVVDPKPEDRIYEGTDPAQLIPADSDITTQIEQYHQKGYAAIPMVSRLNPETKEILSEGYTYTGAEDAVPDTAPEKLLIRDAKRNLRERGAEAIQKQVEAEEGSLKRKWDWHNKIADHHVYQYTTYNFFGMKLGFWHNMTNENWNYENPKNQIVTDFGEQQNLQAMQKKFGIRLGIQQPKLILNEPVKLEDGTIQIAVTPNTRFYPTVEQSLMNFIPQTPDMKPENLFWTLELRPDEMKNGSQKDNNYQKGISLKWENVFSGAQGTAELKPGLAFDVRADICRFGEQIAHGGWVTGNSVKELSQEIADHAIVQDFFAEKEWIEKRQKGQCANPDFIEHWLRGGYSLYNDYTQQVYVPVIDDKTSSLKEIYSVSLNETELRQIQRYAHHYQHQHGRELTDPIGTWVKEVRADKNNMFFVEHNEMIVPAEQVRELAEKVTSFPHRTKKASGLHGQEDYDIRFENAHWCRDCIEVLDTKQDGNSVNKIISEQDAGIGVISTKKKKDPNQLTLADVGCGSTDDDNPSGGGNGDGRVPEQNTRTQSEEKNVNPKKPGNGAPGGGPGGGGPGGGR